MDTNISEMNANINTNTDMDTNTDTNTINTDYLFLGNENVEPEHEEILVTLKKNFTLQPICKTFDKYGLKQQCISGNRENDNCNCQMELSYNFWDGSKNQTVRLNSATGLYPIMDARKIAIYCEIISNLESEPDGLPMTKPPLGGLRIYSYTDLRLGKVTVKKSIREECWEIARISIEEEI